MPESEGELDLPVAVPRGRRRTTSTSARSRSKAVGVPVSAQWAGMALLLLPVPAGVAGWFLADALGAPPPAGIIVGVALFQLLQGYLVLPELVIRRSRPCAEPVRGRVLAAVAEVGRPVADVRILPNRRGPVHNLAAVGIRRRECVVLGEALVAAGPGEPEALATQLVARVRTPAAYLVFPTGLVLWAAFVPLIEMMDVSGPETAGLTAALGILTSLSSLSLGLQAADRRADRRAAAVVGAHRLADALERQHQAATMVPPGFSLWLLVALSQPRLPERLVRLRAAQPVPAADPTVSDDVSVTPEQPGNG